MNTISNQFLSFFHGLLFLFLFIELTWRTVIIIRFPYTFYETAQSEVNLYFDFVFSILWPVKVPKNTFDENNKGIYNRYNILTTVHYFLLLLLLALIIAVIIVKNWS